MKQTRDSLMSIYGYFRQFDYLPTYNELALFYPTQISSKRLLHIIDQGVKRGVMRQIYLKKKISSHDNPYVYTPIGYSMSLRTIKTRRLEAEQKLTSIRLFLLFISLFPAIKLVGLSGSLSMHVAEKDDDIDLFIIASKNRMWTLRMMLNILTFLMGKKRPRNVDKQRAVNKICLNMFFDESQLKIPKKRQNRYIAHELLQMKPMINYEGTYEQLLRRNVWVKQIFPNADMVFDLVRNNWTYDILHLPKTTHRIRNALIWISSITLISFVFDHFEHIAKVIQLHHMRGQITSESVGDKQLWFFKKYDIR